MRNVIVVVGVVLRVAVASAQPVAAEEAAKVEPPSSEFVTLERLDGRSRLGTELAYQHNSRGGGMLFNGALYGRLVDPGSGFGGYATLPFALASGVKGDRTEGELGGGELGVIYARVAASTALVAHAGYVHSTFTDDVDYLAFTWIARPSTILNALAASSVKLGGSALTRSGSWFARTDLGVAVAFGESETMGMLSFGAGAGMTSGRASISLELSGIHLLEPGDSTSANAALAARLSLDRVRPYAALAIPLERALREFFPVVLTLGLDVAL